MRNFISRTILALAFSFGLLTVTPAYAIPAVGASVSTDAICLDEADAKVLAEKATESQEAGVAYLNADGNKCGLLPQAMEFIIDGYGDKVGKFVIARAHASDGTKVFLLAYADTAQAPTSAPTVSSGNRQGLSLGQWIEEGLNQ